VHLFLNKAEMSNMINNTKYTMQSSLLFISNLQIYLNTLYKTMMHNVYLMTTLFKFVLVIYKLTK